MEGYWEVVFHGEIYASVDPVKAREDMARLFKQSPDKVKQLFNGQSWVLKDKLDKQTAERYQVELAKIGLIAELRDRSPTPARKKPEPSPYGQSQEFTLNGIAISRMTCPSCKYEQLEADYCAQCGVNIQSAQAKVKLGEKAKQGEEEEIEKRIRALRGTEPAAPAKSVADAAERMRANVAATSEYAPEEPSGSKAPLAIGIVVLLALAAAGGLFAAGVIP